MYQRRKHVRRGRLDELVQRRSRRLAGELDPGLATYPFERLLADGRDSGAGSALAERPPSANLGIDQTTALAPFITAAGGVPRALVSQTVDALPAASHASV